ncbi:glycosyl transferase family 2 [Motilibacter rhizosphaerae]|uniref:Glycosyl transferase family 2 n=1 Tax=Motilibacter rhizosphaerae TaxID=598652 RepID=A0A4Q7NXF7_9ACTN|nr:glycosyltransferase [Motilibacter rhizosphaerae]RZS91598.1 glycosyl transferase family 2 [Motilibacter rhizosphaerae]
MSLPSVDADESREPSLDLTAPVAPADLSVVICAYTDDRWDDLVAAVQSVLDQSRPVGQLLVVIDHNDGLLARARDRWPALAVLASTGRPGLSGARDTGVAAATGSVVAFLDDDATAAADWSQRTADAYARGPVIGVGGHVEPRWPADRPSWFPPEFDWVVGCSYRGLPQTAAPIRNAIGANMSLRRSVLDAVGGFAGSVGRVGASTAGGEETELYIRARAAFPHGEVLLEPAAQVLHRVTPQRATWRYFVRRCYGEGRSKVEVGRLSSHDAALASERAYVTRTLPAALLRGLVSRDPRRGAAVVIGLGVTVAGYLRARLSQ